MKSKTFLTPAQKRDLHRMAATGRFTNDELAAKFNVSKSSAARYARELVPEPKAVANVDTADELITLGAMVQDARRLASKLGYALTLTKD